MSYSLSLKLRNKILKRDKNICRICRLFKATEIHHILSRARGGKDTEENLISLCRICHLLVLNDFDFYQKSHGLMWSFLCLGFWLKERNPKLTQFGFKKLIFK